MSQHDWHRAWRLDGPGVTLLLAQRGDQLPEPLHWGAALDPRDDPLTLASALLRPLTGGSLDIVPPLSLMPEEGRSFLGAPGLEVCAQDGTSWLTAFVVERIEANAATIAIEATDRTAALGLSLRLAFVDAVLVGEASLTNLHSSRPIMVHRLSAPTLPVAEHANRILGFGGRWIGEFDAFEVLWHPGRHVREGRLGRSSHEHFPAIATLAPGATSSEGEAWGLHLAWSGGHTMLAEELPDGRRQVQFGALMRPGEVILGPGETFATPPLHAAYSRAGRSGLARAFQAHVRASIGHQRRPRPVTCNSWEAVYFDHGLERLTKLAEEAAVLGAERFVLDDGWFGARDDATTSLGDWTVDLRKWPDGLGPLIERVEALGMEFGLWFEPEMINEASELYRAHPDWLLADPAYMPLRGRNQHVLDLARPEVSAYLFERIDALLRAHPIAYVKWDHNRPLIAAAGADGRAGTIAQTRAFYALLDALIAKHPTVEFESCSGGGGRIDHAVLTRAGRVWLSDSNDAVERMRMQNAAAMFLPPEVVGSHVGPRVSHTSRRILSMEARAWSAASRHMGFELDLAELTDAERDTLARAVRWHKANRQLLHGGVPTLLDIVEPGAYGEVVASTDASRFAAFLSYREAPARTSTRPVRLAGLDPGARYRVRLANPEAIDLELCKVYTSPLLTEAGLEASGAALMGAGVQLPIHVPATVFVLEGSHV